MARRLVYILYTLEKSFNMHGEKHVQVFKNDVLLPQLLELNEKKMFQKRVFAKIN